jgi:hypothetical protein
MNEEDLFAPCDTDQRHELDDAHGNIFIDFSNPDDPIKQLISSTIFVSSHSRICQKPLQFYEESICESAI